MRRVTMLVLVLMVGATQGATAASSASAASELIRQVEDLLMLAAPGELNAPEKAISRRNIADANMTAPVLAIGEQMFFPDGSSVRVVALAFPTQMVPVICRNDLAAGACAKLRVGQRISTVNDIVTFQDGFYHNLSLFYVRTLRTK